MWYNTQEDWKNLWQIDENGHNYISDSFICPGTLVYAPAASGLETLPTPKEKSDLTKQAPKIPKLQTRFFFSYKLTGNSQQSNKGNSSF